jgi:hypothetical protein
VTTRLRRLAEGVRPAPAAEERCELCAQPIPPEHRHLVDLERRQLLCACRACSLLFDRTAAGGGHFRLVPQRRLAIEGLRLDDARWDALAIPVGLAFFFESSAAGRVVAFYPSPVGATESLIELETWSELERDNPVLGGLEADVEALLVNRAGEAREHFVAPIDDCYALVGLIRSRWRGLAGGPDAWREIGAFFDRLRAVAKPVTQDGEEAR